MSTLSKERFKHHIPAPVAQQRIMISRSSPKVFISTYYGLFTLPDSDSDSDLDRTPNPMATLHYTEAFTLHKVAF